MLTITTTTTTAMTTKTTTKKTLWVLNTLIFMSLSHNKELQKIPKQHKPTTAAATTNNIYYSYIY